MTINEIFQKFPNKRTIEHIEDNFAFNREDAIRLLKILLKENKYIVLHTLFLCVLPLQS